ncbi:hypothetical protein [Brevundimonas sp. A19_0]|uniref:hypothetical protein n=1 Tax=Brevundimonas sp. A19_0 TaxID=2821087 RepID=UPI001ADC182E|nr:hypothetical protein [Brevundimonas sp. A19_0]MBO9500637.1 hypothetical protein [Brevundimonas sp. A19_0]
MRRILLIALLLGAQGCTTFDASTSPQNIVRGRTIVANALAQPGASDRITLFYGGGRGEREALAQAELRGDEVCGVLTGGALQPVYRERLGGGIELVDNLWVELPANQHRPGYCVSLARIVNAKVGTHAGFLGLRLN